MTGFKRFTGPKGEVWPTEMPPLHWASVTTPAQEVLSQVGTAHAVAILTCKNGHACALRVGGDSRFTVSAAGVVQPSIVCPVAGCDGHEPPGSVLEGYGQ